MEDKVLKVIYEQLEEEFEAIKQEKIDEISKIIDKKKDEVLGKAINQIEIICTQNYEGIEPIINIQIRRM